MYQFVVINENIFGTRKDGSNTVEVFRFLITKGATFQMDDLYEITQKDKVRIANRTDFDTFRVSFSKHYDNQTNTNTLNNMEKSLIILRTISASGFNFLLCFIFIIKSIWNQLVRIVAQFIKRLNVVNFVLSVDIKNS